MGRYFDNNNFDNFDAILIIQVREAVGWDSWQEQ